MTFMIEIGKWRGIEGKVTAMGFVLAIGFIVIVASAKSYGQALHEQARAMAFDFISSPYGMAMIDDLVEARAKEKGGC